MSVYSKRYLTFVLCSGERVTAWADACAFCKGWHLFRSNDPEEDWSGKDEDIIRKQDVLSWGPAETVPVPAEQLPDSTFFA